MEEAKHWNRRTVLAGMGAAASLGTNAQAAKRANGGIPAERVIDVHAHPLLPIFQTFIAGMGQLRDDQAFADRPFLPPKLPQWSAAAAIEAMDRSGISAQVLSLPDVAGPLRGAYARRTARQFNEALAEIVARAPARFGAFAVLPHDDPESTLAELDYALGTLKLDGVCTTTNIRGTYLGDSSFNPWMAELDRRKAVLFVHPTAPAGAQSPFPTYLEFCFDTTRMITNIVLTGTRRRFPHMTVIAAHGGGTIPFLAHRFELLEPLLGHSGLTKEIISADLRSLHYDLTSCIAEPTLAALRAFVGTDRLMLGFDSPYMREDVVRSELARLTDLGGFDTRGRIRIQSENALALFPRLARAMA